MQSIDVHDLPEPVAQAIESMVQTIRTTTVGEGRFTDAPGTRTPGEILASLIEEFRNTPLERDPVRLNGQKLLVEEMIVEKYRKQGLKL